MYDPQNPNDVRHPLNPLNNLGSAGGDDGWGCLSVLIAIGLIVLVVVLVLVLVISAAWVVIAVWLDWWWVLPAIGISYAGIQLFRRNPGSTSTSVLVASTLIVIFMGITGSVGTSAVWTGTGFTRGNGEWIPVWSDDANKVSTEDLGEWKTGEFPEKSHDSLQTGELPE